jgi:hypothetical protein
MELAEWLGVPPQELRFGAEVPARVAQRRKQWNQAIGFEEREIFEAFLRLPVPQRRVVREVIVAFDRAYGTQGSPRAAGGKVTG